MTDKWILTGTESQQQILRDALDAIHFPFERLSLPGKPEMGWQDLNSGQFMKTNQGEKSRAHEGVVHTPKGTVLDTPHSIEGELNGRRYVMGVFYPASARIYLDFGLEQYPQSAMITVAAEVAHCVDQYMPMTDGMRNEIISLLNYGQANNNTWWEKESYQDEYFGLSGEIFMALFIKGFTDLDFGPMDAWEDKGENISGSDVRRILGVERTDAQVNPEPEMIPIAEDGPVIVPTAVEPTTPEAPITAPEETPEAPVETPPSDDTSAPTEAPTKSPVEEPTAEPEAPVEEPAEEPVAPIEEPHDEDHTHPDEPVETPVEEPAVEEPSVEPEIPVEEPALPTEEPESPVEEPAEEPVGEPAEDPTDTAVGSPLEDPIEDPGVPIVVPIGEEEYPATPAIEEPAAPIEQPATEEPAPTAPEVAPEPDSGDFPDTTDTEDSEVSETFVKFKRAKVYHKPDHYDRESEIEITDTAGLRPCKVCYK